MKEAQRDAAEWRLAAEWLEKLMGGPMDRENQGRGLLWLGISGDCTTSEPIPRGGSQPWGQRDQEKRLKPSPALASQQNTKYQPPLGYRRRPCLSSLPLCNQKACLWHASPLVESAVPISPNHSASSGGRRHYDPLLTPAPQGGSISYTASTLV